MNETLIVDWRKKTIHISMIRHYPPYQYARHLVCGQDLGVGDWYYAPEGTVVTCLECIAALV